MAENLANSNNYSTSCRVIMVIGFLNTIKKFRKPFFKLANSLVNEISCFNGEMSSSKFFLLVCVFGSVKNTVV